MSTKLMSWGKYPRLPQFSHSPRWQSDVLPLMSILKSEHGTFLPYGNGRSYGDSCLAKSDNVLYTRGLDRLIQFDRDSGRLVAESGVTLKEILAVTVPAGWFLAVTPGTQYATLGGAIANDVHGKNHHKKGTFGRHLVKFELLRSDRAPAICSSTENADLFSATIGGLGLTGVIAWAEIQLTPIKSAHINTKLVRFSNLREFFHLSASMDSSHEFSVAWVDCLATGAEVGRGTFAVGDYAEHGELDTVARSLVSVPMTSPVSLINNWSLRAFNSFYWHAHPKTLREARTPYESFFYPLDRISHWNRMYGPKGFQQYQCVIPDVNSYDAIASILEVIAKSGTGSFLAVLKRCGSAVSPGVMSFPMEGTSLALDFPQRELINTRLFRELDKIVTDANGRLYPAKDAHMTAADFQLSYPGWTVLERYRDPSINSHFWSRVTQ